jgi:hypothetical protein
MVSLSATALLTGCGGSQPPIGAPGAIFNDSQDHSTTLKLTYKAPGPLLYVANADETLTPLGIYRANADDPKPLATISKNINSSLGACMDSEGTLYVTNAPGSGPGWVSEYAFGQTKPSRVITKGIGGPRYCAIDAMGNLWVTNSALVDVAEYAKGATRPQETITKGLTWPDGIAIDHAGNPYVGNLEPQSARNIQVYSYGSKSPSRTITDGVAVPNGIAVDAEGTLYVTNDTSPGNIEEYRFGESKPYRTITEQLFFPSDVVVGKNGWLYVANTGETTGEMQILEFSPHSVKPSPKKITKGLFQPFGVAYYPPLLP